MHIIPTTERGPMNARIAAFALIVATIVPVSAQLPIPVQGQRADQPAGRGGGRGRGPEPPQAPDPPPVVSPIATATPEIAGPGKFYETLMELKPGDDLT